MTLLDLLINGYFQLPWWGYVLVTLGMTHISIICVTVFLHRHQTHRALDLHPVVSHFFRLWLCFATGLVTKQWVAVHRKHHATVETEDDPHSPQRLGIKALLLSGAEVYGEAYTKHPEILDDYGHGTPDDWLERHIYGRTWSTWTGIFVLESMYILMFGPIGITMWAIQMIWIPFFAAGMINGMTHWWGYRNHACPDASTNLLPWGILIGGEELHNNHHAFASSAKFSTKPWEFDIGWMYIRILSALGLARIKKVAPQLHRHADKNDIDADTTQAFTTHRLELLCIYTDQVLGWVYLEEFGHGQSEEKEQPQSLDELLKLAKVLMDEDARRCLVKRLRSSPMFAHVYAAYLRLQRLTDAACPSLELSREALQDWRQRAGQSGIKVLEDFAHRMPGYSVRA